MANTSANYNFSNGVRKLLQAAGEEIFRLRYPVVTPTHLLLAIANTDGRTVHRLLVRVGIERDELRAATEPHAPAGADTPEGSAASPMYSLEAKAVLEAAIRSAKDLGHDPVGTGHLLLGLMAVPGTARHVLAGFRLRASNVAHELSSLLADG